MATGPEHYRKAERLLEHLDLYEDPEGYIPKDKGLANTIAAAQAHATLALAAATAFAGAPLPVAHAEFKEWVAAASTHPGARL